MDGLVSARKVSHLELCATGDVSFRGATHLLECVRLVHESFPEVDRDAIDLSTNLLGKKLRYPLAIAAMTGGHEVARDVNRSLARIADRRGLAFGLGSQRAMLVEPTLASTYSVRDVAPDVLLFGNLGVVQATKSTSASVERLARDVGADAICIHTSPAMEVVQPGGDRDFRFGYRTIERLRAELTLPIIVKETGSGIGPRTARRLAKLGVQHVDCSGAGGTSWVGVETLRAEGTARKLGERLWDWGVPTAASVIACVDAGLTTIATGGIATGLDVARALALGAAIAGIARPVLKAFTAGGEAGVEAFLDEIEAELRAVMLLTGSATIDDLRTAPHLIVGELRPWMELSRGGGR